MRQFDLCRVAQRGDTGHVVILQHDWLLEKKTCVVAPVLPATRYQPIPRLHPQIEIEGKQYVIALDLMTAIPRKEIGPRIASCHEMQDVIKRGLDTLFYGF